ncbi:MAG: EamA family transporter [bacterium]
MRGSLRIQLGKVPPFLLMGLALCLGGLGGAPRWREWRGSGTALLLGLGPMGTAFFFWDAALKRGDARAIGTMAYLTPLRSTTWLVLFGAGRLGWPAALALVLILGGGWLGHGRGTVVLPAED